MKFVADEDQIIASLELSPIPMVLSNPRGRDNPLEVVNEAFLQLTGYSESEIIGRNCRFLAGDDTEPAATEQIRNAIGNRQPVLLDILNYRRDGTPFRNGVMIAPIFDADGGLNWFLGSQIELEPALDGGLADRRLNAARRIDVLSPRQRDVLKGIAQGLLNKQIAWELKISEKTVKMHRMLLLEKLGVKTSAEAIRLAVEAGF